jgi:antitoxin (DNA-binding transcriptional repressor) of toxin-antitoxin stability system
MLKVTVEEAAQNLKTILSQVAKGEKVILVESNQPIASLSPLSKKEQWLLDTKRFRDSLQVTGESLSATVINARREDKY